MVELIPTGSVYMFRVRRKPHGKEVMVPCDQK